MNYNRNLSVFAKGQQNSTDFWNDFGYWNDGTYWFEKTPTYTARVTAYANATGITDYTILDPLNIFDLGLTYYGLDTIMKAVYPMVTDKTSQSDMANQMKYNFMNPLDTNPAFRLNWVGGWVYSRTGALPNGTNAYADTFLIPSTAFANTNTHMSFYSKTIANVGNTDMGAYWTNAPAIGTYTAVYALAAGRLVDSNAVGYLSNNDPDRIAYTQTNASGMFVLSRTATNSLKMYQNNILKQTNTVVATSVFNTLPQNSILLGALNYRDSGSTSIINYGAKQCAFASIGNGLTDFQADIFSTLVNNLQKALNRAVY